MPTLEWIGKNKVINHDKDVPFRLLDAKYSFDENGQHDAKEEDGNMIIHGDNLAVLKSLLPKYGGRVGCIYIDPPYNTGEEGWSYNDNVNDPQIKKWINEVVGKEGEDLSRHDKWLCMMYPRLKLLHELLSDKGAIFISIDDNEVANLRHICNEIFGNRNFLAQLVWKKKYTGGKGTSTFADYHEYILSYAKNKDNLPDISMARPESEQDKFKYTDEFIEERGKFYIRPLKSNLDYRPTLIYPIDLPDGKTITTQWICARTTYQQLLNDGRILLKKKKDGSYQVYKKFYQNDAGGKVKIPSILEHTNNNEGKAELKQIFNIVQTRDLPFKTPKPIKLIVPLILPFMRRDGIILDSFAGSGTTAHAVMNLNKEDGGNRKFILVEMMDYAENITAERVKRVIKGYGEGDKAVVGTGGGFAFYELGLPLFDGDGNLNGEIATEKIREYIWYTETQTALVSVTSTNEDFLGVYKNTGYYFIYKKDEATTFDKKYLRKLKKDIQGYVVYADSCTVADKDLESRHIKFKKIPRDITRI